MLLWSKSEFSDLGSEGEAGLRDGCTPAPKGSREEPHLSLRIQALTADSREPRAAKGGSTLGTKLEGLEQSRSGITGLSSCQCSL